MDSMSEDMRFDSPLDVIWGFYEPFIPKIEELPELDCPMLMDDESETGCIYRITNLIRRKVYIGKTTQDPAHRMRGHKTCCYHYRDHPEMYNAHGGKRSACYKLYNAILKYGFENFSFEVLLSVPINQLDRSETEQICIHDSINNGYNILQGGDGPGKFTPEILAKMVKKIRAAMPTSVDKIRRNDQSKGLPIYVSWDSELEGFRIRHPTLCNNKNFSVTKHGSIESAKSAAIEFINDLIASGIPYVSDKVKNKALSGDGESLPRGIHKVSCGYVACRQYKKLQYYHRFSNPKQTDQEKLELAKLFIRAADDAFVRLHGAPRKQ